MSSTCAAQLGLGDFGDSLALSAPIHHLSWALLDWQPRRDTHCGQGLGVGLGMAATRLQPMVSHPVPVSGSTCSLGQSGDGAGQAPPAPLCSCGADGIHDRYQPLEGSQSRILEPTLWSEGGGMSAGERPLHSRAQTPCGAAAERGCSCVCPRAGLCAGAAAGSALRGEGSSSGSPEEAAEEGECSRP